MSIEESLTLSTLHSIDSTTAEIERISRNHSSNSVLLGQISAAALF